MTGLQIVTESFANHSRDILGTKLADIPYISVYIGGYGRMDKTTPASGLASSAVADCICVVMHCWNTGRTVLIHAPYFQYRLSVFTPLLEWLAGDTNGPNCSKKLEHVAVEMVFLRGHVHTRAPQMIKLVHAKLIEDLRQLTLSLPFRVNIVDEQRILLSGAVTVDKNTAKITIVDGIDKVLFINSGLTGVANGYESRIPVDMFVSAFLAINPLEQPPDIHLLYDVTKYQLPRALPFLARQLLRSTQIGEDESKQMQILKLAGIENLSDANPNFQMGYRTLVMSGMPCELCNLRGTKRCTGCKGAWYCGKDHQKQDWTAHRAVCKQLVLCSAAK